MKTYATSVTLHRIESAATVARWWRIPLLTAVQCLQNYFRGSVQGSSEVTE